MRLTWMGGLQEHYVLLLGAAVFLELAGAVLFLFNYDLGAYFLVGQLMSFPRDACTDLLPPS